MIDEDLDAFLADHGTACTCGPVGFFGIKDEPDEQMGVGMVASQSAMVTLLVKSSVIAAAGIRSGSGILVGSVAYVARVPVRQDDGSFTQIPLTKGAP
jgi:hypothetical protein